MIPPRPAPWRLLRTVCRSVVVLIVSGLAGATLVRLAPGFGIDVESLDPRLSRETAQARELERAGESDIVRFYAHYLGGLLRGDAGRSAVFMQPVSVLLSERLPVTLRTVAGGLAVGWAVAVLLASFVALKPASIAAAASAISGSFLCIPSALMAILCVLANFPPAAAIAAVIFPRVYAHAYQQIRFGFSQPHVLMARARGLSQTGVFLRHVIPAVLMPILALAGVSVTVALSASIPVEALTDSPGVGSLAWRAAMGRDLPVLVTITLLLTAVTIAANLCADLMSARFRVDSA